MFPLIAVLVGSLLAIGCLIGAFINLRHKRTVDDLPTSKSLGVFIGLTELKGTAESEEPLSSYLAGVRCVQYTWHVDEHWSRTVVETYRDSKGISHTRTRTESGWKTVANGGESIPFYLKDDTGVVQIMPEKAKIQNNKTFDETVGRESPLYFDKGSAGEIANSTHRRRFQEEAIPLHTMLYILGQAREREDIAAAEIAYDKNSPAFMISTRSEKQISSGYGRWSLFWMILGLCLAVGAGAVWAISTSFGGALSWQPFVIMAAGYLIVLLIFWVWTTYNNLIGLHHRVEQAWSQVDVQLKRRNDLIPNIVRTVEGYSQHEGETQTTLAELRAQTEATPPGVKGQDFKGLAPLLRIIIELYPDLKASEMFLKLQGSLVDTEQRIALARDYFNEVATFYNTRLGIIPDRYAGTLARLQPRTLMSAADFERAQVKVKLAE
jgi:hypothetical protein